MKKLIALLMIAATSLNVSAQDNSQAIPFLVKKFDAQKIKSVVSETSGGNITVNAVSPSESRVEVFVTQNGNSKNKLSDEEIKSRIANDYDLEVSMNNETLTAKAEAKHSIKNWKKSLNFSFKIYAPQQVTTRLQTSGGNINLTGISGDQKFATSGGNLYLNSLSGHIDGKTSGGNIYMKNCKNELDLATSGGNIRAENSEGNLTLHTSGGSIQLNDLNGTIDAATSGGNIKGESIAGTLYARTSGGNVSLQNLSGDVKASTSAGNMDVSIVHPGKYITLKNSAGKVTLTIPKNSGMDLRLNASQISTQNLVNFNGRNSKDEIEGTINGGGIPVNVDAGSGKIQLILN